MGKQRKSAFRDNVRHVKQFKNHRVKLRESVGIVGSKQFLRLGLLNVDGLSLSTLEDVKSTISLKSLDVCVLLETKRRHE